MLDSGVTHAEIRAAAFGITIPEGSDIDAALDRLIAKAEQRIAASVPNVADRLESGDLDPDVLAGVVEDMVLRVAGNPEGKKSESIDDYSWTRDVTVASGQLYLSEAELALLLPAAARTPRSFGSIRLAVPAWRLPR